MTSAHIAIRNAVIARLSASPALASGRIEARRKGLPMAQAANEEIRVWLNTSTSKRAGLDGSVLEWKTSIAIHCLARDAMGRDAETRVDSMAQDISGRLLNSARLNGLVLDIEVAYLAWDGEEVDTGTAQCVLEVNVLHRTNKSLTNYPPP